MSEVSRSPDSGLNMVKSRHTHCGFYITIIADHVKIMNNMMGSIYRPHTRHKSQ